MADTSNSPLSWEEQNLLEYAERAYTEWLSKGAPTRGHHVIKGGETTAEDLKAFFIEGFKAGHDQGYFDAR